MIELNIYTITYIANQKEKRQDFIAADPEIAVQNFARWAGQKYYFEPELVELTLLAKNAIHYKTKPKKKK